jgi:hypothetical protein
VSTATPIVDSLSPINPLFLTLGILWILFPLISLSALLLLRNIKSISAKAFGVAALFLGGLGLTINIGVIVWFMALNSNGAAGLMIALDLLMILGIQFPTIYIGYSKLKRKEITK